LIFDERKKSALAGRRSTLNIDQIRSHRLKKAAQALRMAR
jgi:hypothetical protein